MDALTALYQQFDPAIPLPADEHELYVDWQKDLAPDDQKKVLANAIARGGRLPVVRLFTGHRGVGKTTELNRVKQLLEGKGFFVSMMESEQWMDLQDVTATDVIYQMVRQLVSDLNAAGFQFAGERFGAFFGEIWEQLQRPVDFKDLKIKPGAGFEIGIALKEIPMMRAQLRGLLEQRLPRIYELINGEILEKARGWLEKQGYASIVMIVDELDRIPRKVLTGDLTNHENIFVDHANILRSLACDVVYTVPIELVYSPCSDRLKKAYSEVLRLPMIPVIRRDGSDSAEGLKTLCRIMEKRAAKAGVAAETFFESGDLLPKLCRLSGGHVRGLFTLTRSVMDRCDELPLTAKAVRRTVAEHADSLLLPLREADRKTLRKIHEQQALAEADESRLGMLLRNHFVYEYHDERGTWYDWNPLLGEVLA